MMAWVSRLASDELPPTFTRSRFVPTRSDRPTVSFLILLGGGIMRRCPGGGESGTTQQEGRRSENAVSAKPKA